MRFQLPLLVIAFISLTCASEADPYISVVGESVVYVKPDEASVTLGIDTFSPTLVRSKSDNDERAATIIAAIRELGIEEKHIKTSRVAVQIRYSNYDSNVIEGYRSSRTFMITVKNLELLEKLVDSALASGANHLEGIEFSSSETRKYRDEARRMAIRAAKEKATILCNELDVKLGLPISIEEPNIGFWNYEGNTQNKAYFGGDSSNAAEEVIPLGQIPIRASVAVKFQINYCDPITTFPLL